MKFLLNILFGGLLCHAAFAQTAYDFTVAKDGSGDFETLQEAVYAVPALRKQRTKIFVKAGIYEEKLIIDATRSNLEIVGEDAEKTIITYSDFASKSNRFGEEMGTSSSSSVFIFASNMIFRNLTFANAAGKVGQAVAVRVDGDKILFENCRFLGNQDTLYPHGKQSRQYYYNCYIEGTVDFIFGWSTAYFDQCKIVCKDHGYVTAASTEESSAYGFVFNECEITGDAEKGSFYLGRPWRPYAHVVWLNCKMSDVIKAEGWNNWGKESNESTATYAEFGSTGKGANAKDRVSWSNQLTEEEVENYSLSKVMGDWNPTALLSK